MDAPERQQPERQRSQLRLADRHRTAAAVRRWAGFLRRSGWRWRSASRPARVEPRRAGRPPGRGAHRCAGRRRSAGPPGVPRPAAPRRQHRLRCRDARGGTGSGGAEEADDLLDVAAAPEEGALPHPARRGAPPARDPPALDELETAFQLLDEAVVAGRPVLLSPLQFALLWCLASHPNRTFSRDELEARVWRGILPTRAAAGGYLHPPPARPAGRLRPPLPAGGPRGGLFPGRRRAGRPVTFHAAEGSGALIADRSPWSGRGIAEEDLGTVNGSLSPRSLPMQFFPGYAPGAGFDEAVDARGRPREHYRRLAERLSATPADALARRQRAAESSSSTAGRPLPSTARRRGHRADLPVRLGAAHRPGGGVAAGRGGPASSGYAP